MSETNLYVNMENFDLVLQLFYFSGCETSSEKGLHDSIRHGCCFRHWPNIKQWECKWSNLNWLMCLVLLCYQSRSSTSTTSSTLLYVYSYISLHLSLFNLIK